MQGIIPADLSEFRETRTLDCMDCLSTSSIRNHQNHHQKNWGFHADVHSRKTAGSGPG